MEKPYIIKGKSTFVYSPLTKKHETIHRSAMGDEL